MPKVTELDLLQGFKYFVQMLDISFQPENKTNITATEKLVAEYFKVFKDAATTLSGQCMLDTLSWDVIIGITRGSPFFFEADPEFLENHNADLKYNPSIKHKGLDLFAHSTSQFTSEVAKQLAAELIELSIFNDNIVVHRLLALKQGLLRQKIKIDGFQKPYQVLIPFLTLGCLRLEKAESAKQYQLNKDFGDVVGVEAIVLDVLADTVNVLSAMSSVTKPAAGN